MTIGENNTQKTVILPSFVAHRFHEITRAMIIFGQSKHLSYPLVNHTHPVPNAIQTKRDPELNSGETRAHSFSFYGIENDPRRQLECQMLTFVSFHSFFDCTKINLPKPSSFIFVILRNSSSGVFVAFVSSLSV